MAGASVLGDRRPIATQPTLARPAALMQEDPCRVRRAAGVSASRPPRARGAPSLRSIAAKAWIGCFFSVGRLSRQLADRILYTLS